MKSLHQPPRERPIRFCRFPGGFFFGASHDEYRRSQGCEPASLGKYAHAGRTHPGFLHGTAVRLCAQPRYQGVTTQAARAVGGSSRWFPSGTIT
jgi:hypothetical protein